MASAAIALLTSAPLQASVLVYEGFNYGLTNNTTINGATATGQGLTGSWTVTNTIPAGGAGSSLFQTAGLTFGPSFASSGGSLKQTATFSGSNAVTVAAVPFDNISVTGDLWGSYLANYSSISLGSGGFSRLNQAGVVTGGTPTFESGLFSNAVAANRQFYTSFDSTSVNSASTTITTGTNYLFISHYANVGTALGAGTNGTAVTWVMTQAQYDAWDKTEAGLNALTVAGGGITAKTATDTVTSGTFNFGQGNFLSLVVDAPDFNGQTFSGVFDEVRFGTSVVDVAAVPEPCSWALVSLGLITTAFVRRRRAD